MQIAKAFTRDLYDRLVKHFQNGAVFRDLDTIPPGANFKQYIERELAQCKIFIAVIGPRWRGIVGSDGKRRLNKPDDWVRREIEYALERKIPIIPLLINTTKMPRVEDLPGPLKKLSEKNCIWVKYGSSVNENDAKKLIRGIEHYLKEAEIDESSYVRQIAAFSPDFGRPNTLKEIRPKRWDWFQIIIFLIILIPFLYFLFPKLLNFLIHDYKIQQHYVNLDEKDQTAKRKSLVFLTKDCGSNKGRITGYLTELFRNQYCRSLAEKQFSKNADFSFTNLNYVDFRSASLRSANFSSTNLRNADLSNADLSGASFINTDLSGANLSNANLSSVILSNANLGRGIDSLDDLDDSWSFKDIFSSSTDLSNTDLSLAIILATDLRYVGETTYQKLVGKKSPLLCNSPLPENISNNVSKD
ncbi:MAG: pentapeptide repeat-containing protein, partial [Cyanobacteria bacterium J06649_11]